MLIGGDDISNDIITLVTCFSMFVYIRARYRFALIGGNLTWESAGSHRGIGGRIQIPSFSHPATRVPRRACSQANATREAWIPVLQIQSLTCLLFGHTRLHNNCNLMINSFIYDWNKWRYCTFFSQHSLRKKESESPLHIETLSKHVVHIYIDKTKFSLIFKCFPTK